MPKCDGPLAGNKADPYAKFNIVFENARSGHKLHVGVNGTMAIPILMIRIRNSAKALHIAPNLYYGTFETGKTQTQKKTLTPI